jgi:hypothetical protein
MSHLHNYVRDALVTESVPTFNYTDSGAWTPQFQELVDSSEVFETHETVPAIYGGQTVRLVHVSMGMSSEIHEYQDACDAEDDINVMEELGDILWYWAVAVSALGLNPLHVWQVGQMSAPPVDRTGEMATDAEKRLIYHISAFGDGPKKKAMYRRPLDPPVLAFHLGMIVRAVEDLLILRFGRGGEFNLEKTMERNIAKLHKKRFPEGYSDDAANTRDLKGERAALEGEVASPLVGSIAADTVTLVDGDIDVLEL